MPKKKIPSPNEMREWLELRESGWSEAAIANKVGREIRTIKKYLLKAVDERRLNQAQLELVKKALETHQNQLMAAVNSLLGNLESLPNKIHFPWPLAERETIDEGGVTSVISTNQNKTEVEVSPQAEQDEAFTLLKDHLPTDPLWTDFNKWKGAYRSYIVSLVAFKEKAAVRLIEQTSGRYVDETFQVIVNSGSQTITGQGQKIQTDLVVSHLLEFVYRESLEKLQDGKQHLESKDGGTSSVRQQWSRYLIINEERGEVTLGHGHTLVVCPGREHACKEVILSTLDQLPQTTEGKQISNSYKTLAESTTQLNRTLREIRLGLLIPGECRVCRRFKG
jgi:hypothetical protein